MNKILRKALLFEFKGLTHEALAIYKYILKKNPNSKEVSLAINRIAGNRKKFLGVDKSKKNIFIHSKIDNLTKFEKWLIKI